MRRGVLVAGAATAVVAVGVLAAVYWLSGSAASAGAGAATLRTADGSAGCAIVGARVTCSNTTAQERAQPVVLEAGATTSPRARLMSLDWSSAPVLRAGRRRTIGSVSCVATARQLMCYAPDGSGLAVSATQVSAVAAGVQHP